MKRLTPDEIEIPTVVIGPADEQIDQMATVAARSGRRGDWISKVPRRFREARIEDLGSWPGRDDLTGWSRADHPTNLVIVGPVGVGKTHAATAAVRQHFGDGADLEWSPIGELLDRLDWRRADSHQYLERLMSVELLLIDDLGTERANEWTGERLYAVVNRRWLADLPTIATSNLEPEQLEEALGERTYSRLVGGALVLRIAGQDRRRTQ